MIVGYIRVSTEQQDLQKQKHLLFEYAQNKKILIDEFIEIEISSRKNTTERRIEELISKMKAGDTLLAAELSRLGRNMLEVLHIIDILSQKGIIIIFVRQPELSTNVPHTKLLLAIYSYFAEMERDFISVRTKQGMAAMKAMGKHIGRPKGRPNKSRKELEELIPIMENYRKLGFSVATITKLLNVGREKPFKFDAVKYFMRMEFNKKGEEQIDDAGTI